MFTLHTLSEKVRLALKWLGGILGVLLVIFFIIKGAVFVKATFFPTPPPPPTVSFGKLPLVVFPQSVSDITFGYSVDTLSGNLPVFPDRASVVKTVTKESSLFDLDRARGKVRAIGFDFEGYNIASEAALTPTVYEWVNHDELGKKITMNIVTNDFRLSSSYFTNFSVLHPSFFPSEQDAKDKVAEVLGGMGLSPKDQDDKKTRTELLEISDNTLIPATSLAEATVVRVDLFQKDLNSLPIVYAHPPYSTMNFLVGGNDYEGDILQGTFIHQELTEESATYPIKSATQAFDELQKGKAYIARYYGTNKSMPIQKMYLAYYVSEEEQAFIQPVVVFEGKDGFIAYLSAIDSSWYQ